jgi:hypothetical protein
LVWAAIPIDTPAEVDFDSLFARTRPARPEVEAAISKAATPRFKKWFWAAFLRALEPGTKRLLFDHGFEDVSESTPEPEAVLSIQASHVVGLAPGERADPEAVYGAIREWAEEVGANLDRFKMYSSHVQRSSSKGVLAFDTIEPEDAKRIMIPLDIVMKWMRRPS